MESVHDLVRGEPTQALGVSSPISGGVGWNTPIVVEVYALGCGVALVGQRGDLLGRKGSFELEAHGKVFVFDQIGAVKSNRFVAPIEGDIAAIGQPVETIDQEHFAKLGGGAGQNKTPCKTAILSLPQGMGKTTMGYDLAQRLGCTCVVDNWYPAMRLTPGALHLTNCDVLSGGAL